MDVSVDMGAGELGWVGTLFGSGVGKVVTV